MYLGSMKIKTKQWSVFLSNLIQTLLFRGGGGETNEEKTIEMLAVCIADKSFQNSTEADRRPIDAFMP